MSVLRAFPGVVAWAMTALLFAPRSVRAEEVIRVSGTGSGLGSLKRVSSAFEKVAPGVRVQLLPSLGSSGAIAAVANGAIDVGVSGRSLEPEERALGLTATAYARTPFVFAVGPNTGVTGITLADAIRIYRGELTRWPNGERVRLVLRPRTDIDTQLLRAISPEMSAAIDAAYGREGLIVAVTNQECDDVLSRTPGAIGPTTLGQLMTEEHRLPLLAWNGVAPTVPNLASGAYPLGKTLHVVTRVPAPPAVQRLLAFLASPQAATILEETGNLPLAPGTARGDDAERRR